jgi:lipoate-protein ligase A
MGTVRVVIEPEPQSGVRNMALDEALLEAALERGECTVRWYRWNSATVSLGYFQSADAAGTIPGLAELPIVRRLSGGGAILHHHEWTYSCSVPPGHPLAESATSIYAFVHQQVVEALVQQGIHAALRGEALAEREGAFLCFGRGDPRDIVLAGQKILGSAQRRRRGAVLQHGSLLVRASEYARQFPGVLDLTNKGDGSHFRSASGTAPSPTGNDSRPLALIDDRFIRALGESIGALFGDGNVCADYPPPVQERVKALLPKYATLDWGRRGEIH